MNNLPILATILTAGVNGLIVLVTLVSNYRRSINVRFALWIISVVIWDITLYFFYNSFSESSLLIIGRLNFITAIFIAMLTVGFASIFPDNKDLLGRKFRTLIYVSGILLSILTLFSSAISKNERIVNDQIETTYGDHYYLYVVYLVVGFLLSLGILVRKYFLLEEKERSKISYFGLALAVAILWGLTTNVVFPLVGDFGYQQIGPLGTIFFSAYVMYAISRNQFLDIRVLTGRIVYYCLIGGMFYGAYFGIYLMDEVFFGGSETVGAILSGIVNAIIFAIVFVRFNDYLRTQVRSRIINPGYDPLEVTDKLSRKLATLLNVREITASVLDALGQTVRPDYAGVLILPDQPNGKMLMIDTKTKSELDMKGLVKAFEIWQKEDTNYPIIMDELRLEIPDEKFHLEDEIKEMMEYMEANELKVLVPLEQDQKLLGMIVVGKKQSDALYTNQDADFLSGVATTLSLSVTRALYYLEVEDLNKNLQKKVDEATKELSVKNKHLTEALEKLEEVRRQERDMIDVMGHELRTPITIVRNALSVLYTKLKSGEKVTKKMLLEYIDKGLESAKRELNLVETLLSATKVESNRVQLTLTKVDALDVINDALEGHKHVADEKGLKIDYKKPTKEISVYVDRTRIQEVMDNLLSNAIKYTQKGTVKIDITEEEKKVKIAVTDSGMGISKEDIPNLGKKFFRAKQHLKDDNGKEGVVRPGGTGLGLYVSFNLMRLMKGKVKVESEVGKGSTFTIIMPKYTGQKDKHVDQTFEDQ